MRVFFNEKTELYTLKRLVDDKWEVVSGSPAYKHFRGVIAWMNISKQASWAQNWLVVVGKCDDDRLMIMEERGGDLGFIGQAAIDLKDDYLIDKFLVDQEADFKSTLDLRMLDGLTKYETKAHDKFQNTVVYKHGAEDKLVDGSPRWPKFRPERPTCRVVPVMDDDRLNLIGGYQKVRELARLEQIEIRTGCPRTDWVFAQRPPLDYVLDHPLCRAITWGVLDLERTKPRGTPEKRRENPYGNLRG